MERSTETLGDLISQDEFLKQYSYVKKVVASCETSIQEDTAKRWAEDWAWRMKRNAPSIVMSATDLYLLVIEK